TAQRDGGVWRGYGGRRVEAGEARGLTQVIEIGVAVELERLVADAGPGDLRAVDQQVGVGERRRRAGQAEQLGQLLVRPHRDQIAAAGDPVPQERHTLRSEWHRADDRDVVGREQVGREGGDIGQYELIQA